MLRRALIVLGVASILAGIALLLSGLIVPGGYLAGEGAIVTLALIFERWRYSRKSNPQGAAWQPTGERFVDPGSGRLTEVRYNPKTGERAYVPASDKTESP
ncbi:MAG TPA: hypothetical protein VFL54_09240 [Gammaproteobacteria bacterium]|nr:hypothetical protein [Gammaproteobacteria bacterium]